MSTSRRSNYSCETTGSYSEHPFRGVAKMLILESWQKKDRGFIIHLAAERGVAPGLCKEFN